MEAEQTQQELWQLAAVGPEVSLRVQTANPSGTATASAAQVCAWICAQERLHKEKQSAPPANLTIEDGTLLKQQYRSAAMWDRIAEERSQGNLSELKLSLDKVTPAQVFPAWFGVAAKAGVTEIAYDLGPLRINDNFNLLNDLCREAHKVGIASRIPIQLAGEGFNLTESVCRAVVVLKGVLPWASAPGTVSSGLRQQLSPALGAAVEQGTIDIPTLGDLVLGPWFQYLPASNRRALFPVWMAANSNGQVAGSFPGRDEALGGLHPGLKPALTEWLHTRAA